MIENIGMYTIALGVVIALILVSLCWVLLDAQIRKQGRVLDQLATSVNQSYTGLGAQLLSLQTQISSANSDNVLFSSRISSLETKVTVTGTELDEAENDIDSAESLLASTTTRVTSAETLLASTATQLGNTQTQLGNTQTQLGATQTQLVNTETRVGIAEGDIASLGNRVTDTEIDIKTLDTRLTSAETELALPTVVSQAETWEILSGTAIFAGLPQTWSSAISTLISRDTTVDRDFTLSNDGTILFNKTGIYQVDVLASFNSPNTFTLRIGLSYTQGFVNVFNGALQRTVLVEAGSTLQPAILSNADTFTIDQTRLTITTVQALDAGAITTSDPSVL